VSSGTMLFLVDLCDGHLVANCGRVDFHITDTGKQTMCNEFLEELLVADQWLHHGAIPVLRLASDTEEIYFNIEDDQVTIGLRNGRILNFDSTAGACNYYSRFELVGIFL